MMQMAHRLYEPRMTAADEIYETLMAAHEGLSEESSHALNARLILLMANQIADTEALRCLIATARSYG